MKLNLRLLRILKRKQASNFPEQERTGPKNCSEITIGAFISVLCDKDAKRLDYWDEIFEEYLTLTNNTSNQAVLELIKLAAVYNSKAFAIHCLCVVVTLDQDYPGAIQINDELRALTGRPGKGKMTKVEYSGHKNFGISLKLKAKEKEADIQKLNVKNEESTKKDWYDQLSLLGKYQGYRINPDKITVMEYCSILNNFKEDNKPKSKSNGK